MFVKPLTAKLLTIGALTVVLLLPLSQMRSLVAERQGLRQTAVDSIGAGWGRRQVVGPPILEVPTETESMLGERVIKTPGTVHLLPASASFESRLVPERRRLGIYEVPVYVANLQFSGRFVAEPGLDLLSDVPGRVAQWQRARLVVPVADVRGIREVKLAKVDGADLHLQPDAYDAMSAIGAAFDATGLSQGQPIEFRFDLTVAGSESFQIMPLARETSARLASSWPHPNFSAGAFLPVRYELDSKGFDARWQVLELNRGYPQAWPETLVDAERLRASAFGVSLYQPVDTYQRNERAIKYALLFIAITLMSIFLWEQVTGMRLHAMQYLLVGLALCVFYLLLLALSEHLAFGVAYLVAAAALVGLIGVYLAGVLRSRRLAGVAAFAIAAVYALLYLLVLSEQYALLLGAVLVFTVLGTIMLVTRRFDWHAIADGGGGD